VGATSADPAPLRVLVVGQGYVGLPLALRAVEVGDDVTAYDFDARKVGLLRSGRSHISDVSDAAVARSLRTGRYRPVADPDDVDVFDVALITVPTPLSDGVPDVSPIRTAAEMLGPLIRQGCMVVLESTTYPGTTDELVAPVLEAACGLKGGVDFHVGYSPERIDPGNTDWTLVSTPKVVAGLTPASLAAVEAFYGRLVERTVPVRTTRVAELTKLLENTFRHVNIALVNELAVHARAMDIDIWEAIDAAATKPFGFTAFRPGPGVGGHCLPIDPSYLSWRIERQLGVMSRFVVTANDINQHMPAYVVRRVQLGLNDRRKAVKGARILVLGIAYKKNTNDARETPADAVVRGLVDLGADVMVHDEHVGPHELDVVAARVPLSAELLAGCDAVVLVTDHDDMDYELVTCHSTYVFDARNRLRGPHVEPL
jgi:UDP-N-acetyl-D-glucosamine dehydrogenase